MAEHSEGHRKSAVADCALKIRLLGLDCESTWVQRGQCRGRAPRVSDHQVSLPGYHIGQTISIGGQGEFFRARLSRSVEQSACQTPSSPVAFAVHADRYAVVGEHTGEG
jgi:hypothetical protein